MKKQMFFTLILTMTLLGTLLGTLLAVLGDDVNAQTVTPHWVSNNGTAVWTDCQNPTPPTGTNYCNITTANQNAKAGDIVYIRGGVYTGDEFINPVNSGISWTNQIAFSAYNNEVVTVTNQIIPNRDMETEAWDALNGATVTHTTEQVGEGAYSTKFTVNGPNQGIRSSNFTFSNGGGMSWGYFFSAWIYSDQSSINVYVNDGDNSSGVFDQDITITPNKWVEISYSFPEDAGPNAYVAFRSPTGSTSGTWYVDNVRVHYLEPSIFLKSKSYVKVHGINFHTVYRGFVIEDGANNNEISHCEFTDMDMEMGYSSNIIWRGAGAASSYNWIHHNIFHDNGFTEWYIPTNVCRVVGSALRIGGDFSDDSRYNLIEDNTFYHNGHDSINVSTKYNIVRNNVFHNEGWMRNYLYSTGGCQDSDGDDTTLNNPFLFGCRNVSLENPAGNSGYNLIEGNRIGYAGTPANHDGANGIENPTDGNIVRYNYIYANGATGYYFKAQNGMPDNNRVYNNTIYHNGGGQDIGDGYQAGINYSMSGSTGNVIKNNIVFNNAQGAYRGADNHSLYEMNTYTNNIETEPLFVNPDLNDKTSLTLPNLGLQSGSSAINKGAALTTVAISDTGHGVSLIVADASYFQDGSWATPGKIEPDWIAVGSVDNVVQISALDYASNVITLTNTISRSNGASIWLYKNSTGDIVLHGSAPDIGAYEFAPNQYLPLILK